MNIDPERLEERLAAKDRLLILDVRSKFEYSAGHLPGAVYLPFWKTPFLVSGITDNKDVEIVLYCEHGPRAVLAGKVLGLMGYGNLRLLKGHMHRWRREKRSIVK